MGWRLSREDQQPSTQRQYMNKFFFLLGKNKRSNLFESNKHLEQAFNQFISFPFLTRYVQEIFLLSAQVVCVCCVCVCVAIHTCFSFSEFANRNLSKVLDSSQPLSFPQFLLCHSLSYSNDYIYVSCRAQIFYSFSVVFILAFQLI